ncbi:MAG TPA: hypothetical protein VGG70_11380, partial [Candidatus Cybelea sp.]
MRAGAHLMLLTGAIVTLTACATGPREGPAGYDPRALPPGAVGESIAYGRAIVMDTPSVMKGFVRAKMSCAAC